LADCRAKRLAAGKLLAAFLWFASPSAILRSAAAIASVASSAFAMSPLKRGADFDDGLVEIFIQPRDLLLLFAEFFGARCRFCPTGSG
jgi:hypothetical protein